MSDVSRALEQIAEIREQLGRTAVFRGWRPIPVASSGLVGVAAAWWQAADPKPPEPWHFTVYWLAVGVVALLIGCAEIAWHYVVRADEVERGRSRHVVGQFLPALMAGALVTGAFIRLSPALVALLPGLWALFFGVGVFATRPYAVRGSHWIALYYWTAGLALLWKAQDLGVLSPWAVGGTFGVGQILAAGVLYVNLERPAPMTQRIDDDDTQA
jgi:hypothetical protein